MTQIRRYELQDKLETILGSKNVYFQPPENIKLKFPCIIYHLSDIDVERADNKAYIKTKRYTVTFITKDSDSEIVDTLLEEFPMMSFTNAFTAENLYHFVYDLFY